MRKLLLGLATAIALFSAGLGGTYKGTWSGSGGGGDFTITLTKSDAGDWKGDVTFGFGGETVKTKVTSVKVDGDKLTVVYTFDLQGTALESTVSGELKDGAISGGYHTKALADNSAVDEGTWKASGQ